LADVIEIVGQGLDKTTRALCSLPEVLECHRATGGDCFVLRVAVPDIKELERLLDRMAPFGDLTTSVILSTPLWRRIIEKPAPHLPAVKNRPPSRHEA
jgi:Lrp/AsnC family leucine-responsive transcriptional regulator